MPGANGGSEFWKAAEPILRKCIENIESPYIWAPLLLFILSVLAYPITKFKQFLYLALAFLVLALGADWYWRIQNRETPPAPRIAKPADIGQLKNYLATVQGKAVRMIESGKISAARDLTEKNLKAIDDALKRFPDDPKFHTLLGYTLKDMGQIASRSALPDKLRQEYLDRARESFQYALKLKPDSAGAYNGLGSVLILEGRCEEARIHIETALKLANGNYPAAKHDLAIVDQMCPRAGEPGG